MKTLSHFYTACCAVLCMFLFAACGQNPIEGNADPLTKEDDVDRSVEYEELVCQDAENDSWYIVQYYTPSQNLYSITISYFPNSNKRQSFDILLTRDKIEDVMLPSGKYSTEATDDTYKILKSSMGNNKTTMTQFKKSQMYVTITDKKKGLYHISAYIQLKDGSNYHLTHNGQMSELQIKQ